MASAGIQFVATANASPVANGNAAMSATSEGAPVDFAALLFAAQAAPITPGFVDLEGLGVLGGLAASGADAAEDGEEGDAPLDLALLFGGLIVPPPGGVAKGSAANASAAALDAAQGEETAAAGLPAAKHAALFADADADAASSARFAALSGRDGTDDSAAILAESANLLPAGTNGNHFGHLLGNHGVNSAAQPQGGAPAASVHVATSLHDPQWGQDFSQRVVWMARSEMQSAHLSLNPANLGPIEVTLNLGAEQATAIFSSPHVEVREALESALPRLREMLAGAGISLGDAQVNAQSQRDMAQSQQSGQRSGTPGEATGAILGADDAVNAKEGPTIRRGLGLIDTFA